MLKVAVLVSGGGTNLQAIIDAVNTGKITNAEISLVISNNKNAYALERAKNAGIESCVCNKKTFTNNGEFEDALISVDEVFDIYPKIIVNERQKGFLINGVRVRFKGLTEGKTYRVYDENGEFLSLSECIEERLTLVKAFWN